MRRIPQNERPDFACYGSSLVTAARHPVIFLGPLLAGAVVHLITRLSPDDFGTLSVYGGALGGGLGSLLKLIIAMFGYALAIIVADMAWRGGAPSFDDAWAQTRRKGGDIVFAALGLSMVVYVAWYVGGMVFGLFGLGGLGALALALVAFGALAYTVAASAIGGVPGGLSLQASLDIAKSRPINTVLLTIFMIAVTVGVDLYLPLFVQNMIARSAAPPSDSVAALIGALCDALALGYIATVVAKRYADSAFRNA